MSFNFFSSLYFPFFIVNHDDINGLNNVFVPSVRIKRLKRDAVPFFKKLFWGLKYITTIRTKYLATQDSQPHESHSEHTQPVAIYKRYMYFILTYIF